MELQTSMAAFVLAVLLISVSPGPAMALIVRRAALRGLRSAVPTVLGLELGLYVWALYATPARPTSRRRSCAVATGGVRSPRAWRCSSPTRRRRSS